MASTGHDTPAMRQYRRFKEQHPGCVLFFRMGDFYEMFYEDAQIANRVLGVTLTQRTEGIPMAGVPYHAVEGYLRRMIQAGHRVAVCEQVQDASEAKGVVERDVTRVITPGTLTDETLLEEGRENPLAAVVFLGGGGEGPRGQGAKGSEASVPSAPSIALAWAELSTGAFQIAALTADEARDELTRIAPRELLFCETATGDVPERVTELAAPIGCSLTPRPPWQFRLAEAREALRRQYGVSHLAGFGLDEDDPAIAAAGAVLAYLLETQRADSRGRLAHLRPPKKFERTTCLVVDGTSLRSLEIERTMRTGETHGSVLGVLQSGGGCVTAMGKRMLRQWLCYPLCSRHEIEARQSVVEALVNDSRFLDDLRDAMDGVQDVERIGGRLAVGRVTPRDLVALGKSAAAAEKLAHVLADRPTVAHVHNRLLGLLEPMAALAGRIAEACVEDAPGHLRDGGLIRDGYDATLDEHRSLQRDANTWLAGYQKQLIEDTGVPSLKVGYNKVFGYYIEITAAHRDKFDAQADRFRGWHRKQTLKNAERFITPELKTFEEKVLSAGTRAVAREAELFTKLCEEAVARLGALHAYADLVAGLDVLGCFARRAVRHRYVKPTLVDEPVLRIEAGRHPVLDDLLGDRFVPNDVALGRQGAQGTGAEGPSVADPLTPRPLDPSAPSLALITGPNMAGKSTYIRQAALITLLAHTGSFVPADRAVVGLCDRLFTRIGASDELHAGHSTFMVEMVEAANICHHATPRSLVILDEIGRGTSTLDGLSIAWAIAEHLAQRGSRTLFATHYHEMTTLAEPRSGYPNVTNLNVTVREWQDEIVFLHRIAPGKADRSYGIHVAKIAGMPREVVDRANDLLQQLAVSHSGASKPTPAPAEPSARRKREQPPQLSLFMEYLEHPALAALREADLTRLSPMEAFDLLRRLQEQAQPDLSPAHKP